MYDFEPQAVCHFLIFFSLVCIYGIVFKSDLIINKSHVGAAIFDSGVCKNMWKKYENWSNQYLKPDFKP